MLFWKRAIGIAPEDSPAWGGPHESSHGPQVLLQIQMPEVWSKPLMTLVPSAIGFSNDGTAARS